MIPIAEARRLVLASCSTKTPQHVDVGAADGLVLAEAVHATESVPSFANSAMDGYALRAADVAMVPAVLQIVGAVMAGDGTGPEVGPGQAARIMTGALLPSGADAVCIVEHTRPGDGPHVVVDRRVEPGENIRWPGEDIAAGSQVFAPGTVLSAAHIGVLASLGIGTVLAHRRPSVGVLSTGNELMTSTGPLAPGKIRDANRPALLAQLSTDGVDTVDLGVVADDAVALAEVLERHAPACDAVVTSGGVSVGDRDVVKEVLDKLAPATAFWMQVAVKPAKPFAFGTLAPEGTVVFGLPGNPVSAFVSYELFVRPALRAMAGRTDLDRPRVSAVAEVNLARRPDGKVHLLKAVVRVGHDGRLSVRPVGGQGSHQLRALADANALAVVPDGDGVGAGEPIDVLLLGGWGSSGSVGMRW